MKKRAVSIVIALLCFSAASQTSYAHTVSPVNPDAGQTTKAGMNWLAHLPNRSDNRVMSGAFDGYSRDTFSVAEADRLIHATGQLPAVYGCDYARGWLEPENIADTIGYSCNSELISYWKSGGIPQISMHLANPAYSTGHFKTPISNSQYQNILDSSTTEGKRLDAMLGKIADGLQQLKDEGVTVLFRPLHEINGDGFGGGLDSIIKKQRENLFVQTAYQKIYHYMTNERGLDNLLWVYAPDANRDFKTDFYPSVSYVDIVGLDAYFTDSYSIKGYDELTSLHKLFAFTEVGPQETNGGLDYSSLINAIKQNHPKTVYFLAWNDGWSPAANKGAANSLS